MDEIRVLTRQTTTAIEEDVRLSEGTRAADASWPAREPLPAPTLNGSQKPAMRSQDRPPQSSPVSSRTRAASANSDGSGRTCPVSDCYDHTRQDHCRGLQCPECYRFSAHSWRHEMSTQNRLERDLRRCLQ